MKENFTELKKDSGLIAKLLQKIKKIKEILRASKQVLDN